MESRDASSVLERLLKTNLPPTDEERAVIQASVAPIDAKLRVLEAQISEMMAFFRVFKSQVSQAEYNLLQRWREEKAGILKTSADHHRALSAFRYLPEDVLREICIACVKDDIPTLSDREIPLPYVLGQISSGMRHITLTTHIIWARMDVQSYSTSRRSAEEEYSIIARKAIEWFRRAGGLPLTLFLWDSTGDSESDPSKILFDALLSYSAQWKEIKVTSKSQYLSRGMMRIAALSTIDLPLLESVSLDLACFISRCALPEDGFLSIPTIKHVSLLTNILRSFTVNWAGLTSLFLNSRWDNFCYSMNKLAEILQQTKQLKFCDVYFVGWGSENGERHLEQITLPFLKTLYISDRSLGPPSSGTHSLIDLITAPALETLGISPIFLQCGLSDFLQRSPNIWKLSLPYFPEDALFTKTIGFLRYCQSLTVLSLRPPGWGQGLTTRPSTPNADMLLRVFVDGADICVLCPLLQSINFQGEIDFSLQTLQLFLDGKHGDIATPDIAPWKRVILDIRGIKDTETRQQILGFVSQKKARGLDVDAFSREEIYDRDRYFYR